MESGLVTSWTSHGSLKRRIDTRYTELLAGSSGVGPPVGGVLGGPSTLTFGKILPSHPGTYQFALPNMVMSAGTNASRTTNASSAIATASERPKSLIVVLD